MFFTITITKHALSFYGKIGLFVFERNIP